MVTVTSARSGSALMPVISRLRNVAVTAAIARGLLIRALRRGAVADTDRDPSAGLWQLGAWPAVGPQGCWLELRAFQWLRVRSRIRRCVRYSVGCVFPRARWSLRGYSECQAVPRRARLAHRQAWRTACPAASCASRPARTRVSAAAGSTLPVPGAPARSHCLRPRPRGGGERRAMDRHPPARSMRAIRAARAPAVVLRRPRTPRCSVRREPPATAADWAKAHPDVRRRARGIAKTRGAQRRGWPRAGRATTGAAVAGRASPRRCGRSRAHGPRAPHRLWSARRAFARQSRAPAAGRRRLAAPHPCFAAPLHDPAPQLHEASCREAAIRAPPRVHRTKRRDAAG